MHGENTGCGNLVPCGQRRVCILNVKSLVQINTHVVQKILNPILISKCTLCFRTNCISLAMRKLHNHKIWPCFPSKSIGLSILFHVEATLFKLLQMDDLLSIILWTGQE